MLANRLWQFHFGRGLVALVQRPGSHGRRAHSSRAARLAGLRVDGLRLAAQAATPHDRAVADIPAIVGVSSLKPPRSTRKTRCYGATRQRRLEAEVIRDSILAISGQLNTQMAGPGFYPTLPTAVLEGQSQPGQGWGKSDEREQARRSVYIFAKRSLGVPEIELLDAPDTTSSCEQRIVSTTGPQALAFLNGAFIHEQARHFAARLVAEAGARSRETRWTARLRWPWAGLRGLTSHGPPSSSSRNKSSRSRPRCTGAESASQRRPAQGPRGILPGRLEYERIRLQQLTGRFMERTNRRE